VLARSQQVVRFDEEEDADLAAGGRGAAWRSPWGALADGATALVLEDYNKGVLVPAVIETAIGAARAAGVPVVVDPKFRNFFAYAGPRSSSPTAASSRPRSARRGPRAPGGAPGHARAARRRAPAAHARRHGDGAALARRGAVPRAHGRARGL
jgi:hypothetical protein